MWKLLQRDQDVIQRRHSPHSRLHMDAVRKVDQQQRRADHCEADLKAKFDLLKEAVQQLESLVSNQPSCWLLKSAGKNDPPHALGGMPVGLSQ